jgi:hypothetical protein
MNATIPQGDRCEACFGFGWISSALAALNGCGADALRNKLATQSLGK